MACLKVQMIGGGCMSVSMTRKGGIKARMGLVCGTNLGVYQYLWSSEHQLITINNQYLLVRKSTATHGV